MFRLTRTILLPTVGLLIAAGSAWAQEPVRIPLDNDDVRVSRNVEDVGHRSGAHGHANSKVSIFLDAGEQTLITPADDHRNIRRVTAGDAIFDGPVVQHISVNSADTRLRIIQVDIKKPAGGGTTVFGADDPLTAAPRQFTLIADNPQVRVLRLRLAPGERTPVYRRSLAAVTTLLTPQHLKTTANGVVSEQTRAQYDVTWDATPATLQTENLSREPFEAVLVELKTR